MKAKNVILQFNNKSGVFEEKHVREGLSAVARIGNNLFIASDEGATIDRLRLLEDGTFGNHKKFHLKDYLNISGSEEIEIDIEGLSIDKNKYLWIVGSHSKVRKKPKKNDSPEKQIERLAKVKEIPSRNVLARIPITKNLMTGNFELAKSCPNPVYEGDSLTAGMLFEEGRKNQLLKALDNDEHFKDFMKIPGKDNGFDIEGLAVINNRIFLGLRGPVLRGWACILEIQVEDTESGGFRIKENKKGKLYKKHFIHLVGMGIRELTILGNDMLILAGPTMDLDGTISVFLWKDALNNHKDSIVPRKELLRLFDVPHGNEEMSGQDKAEGMCIFDDEHLLIVFDTPADYRKLDDDIVVADLFKYQEPVNDFP